MEANGLGPGPAGQGLAPPPPVAPAAPGRAGGGGEFAGLREHLSTAITGNSNTKPHNYPPPCANEVSQEGPKCQKVTKFTKQQKPLPL